MDNSSSIWINVWILNIYKLIHSIRAEHLVLSLNVPVDTHAKAHGHVFKSDRHKLHVPKNGCVNIKDWSVIATVYVGLPEISTEDPCALKTEICQKAGLGYVQTGRTSYSNL